jgi:hypothetical protein
MEGASDENAHPCCLQRLGNPGVATKNSVRLAAL